MVVCFRRRAFQVIVFLIGRVENSIPGAVLVINEIPVRKFPCPVVPIPVGIVPRSQGQSGGGGKGLGEYPVVAVVVEDLPVGRESIVHAFPLSVPAFVQRGIEKVPGSVEDPGCGAVALEDQQQLSPFDEVTGEVAIGFEEVFGVVSVVVPVVGPVAAVVFPDQSVRSIGEVDADTLCQQLCAVEILVFLGGFIGGQHGFAHMHIGVLTAIGCDGTPIASGDFVDIELGVFFPKAFFQHFVEFRGQGCGAVDSGFGCAGSGQEDEGVAVAVPGAIF